jgi:hypothetical protein
MNLGNRQKEKFTIDFNIAIQGVNKNPFIFISK